MTGRKAFVRGVELVIVAAVATPVAFVARLEAERFRDYLSRRRSTA